MRRPGRLAEHRWVAAATRRSGRLGSGVVALAVVVLMLAGCARLEPFATACPELAGWPPSLPPPPEDVVVTHPAGTVVRVLNGTDRPIKVRFRTWTPGDCAATPPFVGDAGSDIAPGRISEWSGDVPSPVRGPVLGGLEIWTRGCDETCSDPPDSFVSFEVPRTP